MEYRDENTISDCYKEPTNWIVVTQVRYSPLIVRERCDCSNHRSDLVYADTAPLHAAKGVGRDLDRFFAGQFATGVQDPA